MLEIRWHGRGGQGAITVSRVLAMAALKKDLFVQSFPEYGPERGHRFLCICYDNEAYMNGRFIAFVAPADAERALALMRADEPGHQACLVGHITEKSEGLVTMKSRIGATRILDMLSGEQLPRIC